MNTHKNSCHMEKLIITALHNNHKNTIVHTRPNEKWFYFKDHKWNYDHEGIHIRKAIINEIEKMDNISPSEKFKTYSMNFTDKILGQCFRDFVDDTFLNKLNSNVNLICFDNGVYDLEKQEFRSGLPSDYMSISVGYDYIEPDLDSPIIGNIFDFFNNLSPDFSLIEYYHNFLFDKENETKPVTKTIDLYYVKYLCGFSTFQLLLKSAFGRDYIEYFHAVNHKDPTANRYVGTNATKFIFVNEYEDDKCCDNQIRDIKNFVKREQYNMKKKLKRKIIMSTYIEKDSFNNFEAGCLKEIEIKSRFVDNPLHENEYKRDPYMLKRKEDDKGKIIEEAKVVKWKQHFMFVLLNYSLFDNSIGSKKSME